MVNGEPEFGWRDFGGIAPDGMVLPSAIMLEAAQKIDDLTEALASCKHEASFCIGDSDELARQMRNIREIVDAKLNA